MRFKAGQTAYIGITNNLPLEDPNAHGDMAGKVDLNGLPYYGRFARELGGYPMLRRPFAPTSLLHILAPARDSTGPLAGCPPDRGCTLMDAPPPLPPSCRPLPHLLPRARQPRLARALWAVRHRGCYLRR